MSKERLYGLGGLEIKASHFWVSNIGCSEAAACKGSAVGSVSVLRGQPAWLPPGLFGTAVEDSWERSALLPIRLQGPQAAPGEEGTCN